MVRVGILLAAVFWSIEAEKDPSMTPMIIADGKGQVGDKEEVYGKNNFDQILRLKHTGEGSS